MLSGLPNSIQLLPPHECRGLAELETKRQIAHTRGRVSYSDSHDQYDYSRPGLLGFQILYWNDTRASRVLSFCGVLFLLASGPRKSPDAVIRIV